jgi:hypothetical protein
VHNREQARAHFGGQSVSESSHAGFAKLPEFHRFCLQTAVNHANGAGDGFAGKSAIVIKSLLLAGRANIAGIINL